MARTKTTIETKTKRQYRKRKTTKRAYTKRKQLPTGFVQIAIPAQLAFQIGVSLGSQLNF